jgi:hypothetical protein
MDLMGVVYEDVKWIELANDRDLVEGCCVSMGIDLQILQEQGISCQLNNCRLLEENSTMKPVNTA